MKTCKTCHYRNDKGYCKNYKLHTLSSRLNDESKSLIYESHDFRYFWVGVGFGCIHYKELNETI